MEALRDDLAQHLLTLPDGPETPLFTIENFDELTREAKSTESSMKYEQTVGHPARLEDGTELMFLGGDNAFMFDD